MFLDLVLRADDLLFGHVDASITRDVNGPGDPLVLPASSG
jgi:hypothetical protein